MNKKNKKRNIALIITVSIVIIFFLSGFSIGKEMMKTNVKTTGSIAEPILKVENSETVHIDNNKEKDIYEFTVKNYDEQENINQVDLEYYVEILTNIDSRISLKLYKNDNEILLNNNKTENFIMPKNKKQEDKYKVEIVCDEEKQIRELIQNVQMKVYSEQKRK